MIQVYEKTRTTDTTKAESTLLLEPVLVTRPQAARVMGVSLSTLDGLVASGGLQSVQLGGRRMFRPADLRTFAASLPAASSERLKRRRDGYPLTEEKPEDDN